jgi:hypothetical protein
MIEKKKCTCCSYVYEISWDDESDHYYNEDRDDDCESDDKEELVPEYCPFCGVHREYGGEGDSYDDFDDK